MRRAKSCAAIRNSWRARGSDEPAAAITTASPGRQPTSRSRSRITAARPGSGPSVGVTDTSACPLSAIRAGKVGVHVITRRQERRHDDRRSGRLSEHLCGVRARRRRRKLFAAARFGSPPPRSGHGPSAPRRRCGCRVRPGSAFGRVDRQPVATLDHGLYRTRCAERTTAAGPSPSRPRECLPRRRATAREAAPATPPTRDSPSCAATTPSRPAARSESRRRRPPSRCAR